MRAASETLKRRWGEGRVPGVSSVQSSAPALPARVRRGFDRRHTLEAAMTPGGRGGFST